MRKLFAPAIVLLAVIVTWLGVSEDWKPLTFKMGTDIGGALGTFVSLSLLVERSVEVILTLWRAHDAEKLELAVNQLTDAAIGNDRAVKMEALARIDDAKARQLMNSLSAASAADSAAMRERDMANSVVEAARNNPANSTLQSEARVAQDEVARLEQAAIGARIRHTFIDPTSTLELVTHQASALKIGDIILTGIVLAGGSDPIHKLMDLYRKFMESSSAKATAAK